MLSRLAILAALVVAASSGIAQAPPLEQMDLVLRAVPDGPVAHVNGVPIPRAEFVQMYGLELTAALQSVGGKAIPDRVRVGLALRSLSNLVNQELLYQEAVKLGFKPTPDEIEKRWKQQIEEFQKGDPKLTEADVLKGMGVKDRNVVMKEVERMLLVDKMSRHIVETAGVKVEEKDLTDLYQKNKEGLVRPDTLHIRQLFVRAPAEAQPRAEARKRAEHALARIQAGQLFEAVVKDVSESPGADSGGDMGPGPLAQFPPFLIEPALKMKPDQISGVIESEYGFHIIKFISSEKGSDLTYESAKPFLERTLMARRAEEAILDHCDKLVNGEAEILVYLELEKSIATDPEFEDLIAGQ